jgi:leader peptidase (prepilin peptidase)/N-methyltransferase
MVWRFGWSATLPAFLYLGAILVVISAADLTTGRVPNRVVLPAYIVGPGLFVIASAISGTWSSLVRAGVGMALMGAFFLVLALMFPRGMGMGDPLTVSWRESSVSILAGSDGTTS